ncbi:peroxiredoxin family protein [Rhizobium beringeri]
MTSDLGIDSPAPSINVQHWLRGDPLSNFQLGKIYILEFVSTTCSGCGPALARLAQLQEEYSDIGVELIGITANERAATADEAPSSGGRMGDQMAPQLENSDRVRLLRRNG